MSGSVLLGDFEDGTAKPQDPRFAVYHYYAYNPGMSMTPAGMSMNVSPPPSAFFVGSPLVSPGYNSNHALGLNWQIMDVPDGVLNHPGVALQTDVSTGFVDLSGYDRVVFAQQYRYSGACQPLQMLKVIIRCDELNTDYEASVAVSPTWITSSLSFSKFVEASNKPASGHTFSECLAVTNSVVFQAQVDLADGDCDSGSLALDNIEIRPAAARPESGGDAGASSGADGGDAASSPTDAGL